MCAESRASSDSEAESERRGLYFDFDLELFRERDESTRLLELIHKRTPSVGIAGPRGSGKTWLIRWAVERAKRDGAVGTWFRCSAKYDEREFTMALFERLCEDMVNQIKKGHTWLSILGGIRLHRLGLLAFAAAVGALTIALGVLFSVTSILASETELAVLGVLAFLVVVLLIVATVVGFFPGRWIPIFKALELQFTSYEQLEYLRYAESVEKSGGVEIGAAKGFKVTGQLARKLVQRPLTYIGVVERFRAYTGQIAAYFKGPVVIAVDDLDKLHDPDDAREFVGAIAGLFGSNVSFIVALSDEAVEAYELRTFGGRDELDSSFGDIIRVRPLTVDECSELLEKRGVARSSPLLFNLLGVLSAGNSKDLIRQARETYFTLARPLSGPEREEDPTLTSAGWQSIPKQVKKERDFAKRVVTHFAWLESEAAARRIRWMADLSEPLKKKIAESLTIENVNDLADFVPGGAFIPPRHPAYPIVRRAETRLAVMSFIVKRLKTASLDAETAQALQDILVLNEISPLEAKDGLRELSLKFAAPARSGPPAPPPSQRRVPVPSR